MASRFSGIPMYQACGLDCFGHDCQECVHEREHSVTLRDSLPYWGMGDGCAPLGPFLSGGDQQLALGITRLDVLTYFMVGVVLSIAVVLATIVPARRAASIEPVRALRTE